MELHRHLVAITRKQRSKPHNVIYSQNFQVKSPFKELFTRYLSKNKNIQFSEFRRVSVRITRIMIKLMNSDT